MRGDGEEWVVVYADGMVSRPLTKKAARARSALSYGSYVTSRAALAEVSGRYSDRSLSPGPKQQNRPPGA